MERPKIKTLEQFIAYCDAIGVVGECVKSQNCFEINCEPDWFASNQKKVSEYFGYVIHGQSTFGIVKHYL
jgi:hypothetical protein